MSDEEEESMSEGFSPSEDEWKPAKDVRGGESSDDDDSDFDESPQAIIAQNIKGTGTAARRKGAPGKGVVKQTAVKKRKGVGQSLRTKLYNKYRPPPKTFPSPNSVGSNSPSASTSRTASKNVKMPNESIEPGNDSSSESSVEDYLVNPADIDLQSSFFNVRSEGKDKFASSPPPPIFDCNVGIGKLSDSGSEDNNDSSAEEHNKNNKSFNFADLLENVNSLERAKETIAKRTAAKKEQNARTTGNTCNSTTMDVNSLLALGEKQGIDNCIHGKKSQDVAEEEDEDEREIERAPLKLSKTKSTRVKRHTKTRPTSTIVPGDTDDSDFEEVAEDTTSVSYSTAQDSSALLNTSEGIEIHVDLPSKKRHNKEKKDQDLEAALKRKLNRDLKERFLHLHKTSLLCCFARSYRYNRMLNDTPLMQAALKLLPSSNAYPPDSGTEIKYFQSMVTWYKTAVKLASPNLYGEKVRKSRRRMKRDLIEQIRRKEASCKQDYAFIFIILLRAMGLQCRLIVNMQPLPLRPAQSDLLTIKLKKNFDIKSELGVETNMLKVEEGIKTEKNHGQRSERSLKEEKKIGKEKEEKIQRKVDEDNKSSKRDIEKKHTNVEKKEEAIRDLRQERKRAPSQKLSELIASHKKENTERDAKKAKTETKQSPQRSSKRMKMKMVSKKSEAQVQKEIMVTKTTKEVMVSEREKRKNEIDCIPVPGNKPTLARLKGNRKAIESDTHGKIDFPADKPCLSVNVSATPIARRTRKASTEKKAAALNRAVVATKEDIPTIQIGSPILPKIVIQSGKTVHSTDPNERKNEAQNNPPKTHETRSRSKSPKVHISPTFMQSTNYKNKFPEPIADPKLKTKGGRAKSKSPIQKLHISPSFLQTNKTDSVEMTASGTRSQRVLRSRQQDNENGGASVTKMAGVPQLDGADDSLDNERDKKKRTQLKKLNKKKKHSSDQSDEDFQPSPQKQPKKAPSKLQEKKVNRRVVSSEDEEDVDSGGTVKCNPKAADIWVEVWSDAEEQWVCIELYKGKIHSVEAIRRAASSSLAYVFAFQNDLSIKDVTARYCPNWTRTVRKSRVERNWLEASFTSYHGQRTKRDIRENQELRRIHEEKPMPTAISEYKDHPLYALERHLLKFQAIYPPNPPTLGFVRGEPVYARECVHTLHSREIWLKQARTVKLGEQPYKIVKARPKWDRLTQTVIKDQPLEIFGYWQTKDYEPPTAENGVVPRNAYGNVELFKECMLPKKTVHLRLPGLNRICKKLGIDCAQAVTGFDFHQGACHPLYDGFVVCEEFGDQVTAAWYQDQEEQEKKEQDKYEARVYGNWKKLIKGLLIRERLKKKYNF